MAITLKELREKEFTRQVRGYSIDEVDDFLDELADQMESLVRENRALSQKLSENAPAKEAAPAVEAAPVVAAVPARDDSSYFRTLETTLRETLLNAERTAKDTVAEAQKKAEDTVTEAQKKAEDAVAEAQKKAEELVAQAEEKAQAILDGANAEAARVQAENEQVHQGAEAYRQGFVELVKSQMEVLKAADILF